MSRNHYLFWASPVPSQHATPLGHACLVVLVVVVSPVCCRLLLAAGKLARDVTQTGQAGTSRDKQQEQAAHCETPPPDYYIAASALGPFPST